MHTCFMNTLLSDITSVILSPELCFFEMAILKCYLEYIRFIGVWLTPSHAKKCTLNEIWSALVLRKADNLGDSWFILFLHLTVLVNQPVSKEQNNYPKFQCWVWYTRYKSTIGGFTKSQWEMKVNISLRKVTRWTETTGKLWFSILSQVRGNR